MKKLLIALALMLTLTCNAQNFRDPGYKGNVSYTSITYLVHGFDTSHGYMLDRHNYIGGGVGIYAGFYRHQLDAIGHIFIDYTAYWLKRDSTPYSSVKIGWYIDPFCKSVNNLAIEPAIGWSWEVDKIGLDFGFGCKFIPEIYYEFIPAATFTLNF